MPKIKWFKASQENMSLRMCWKCGAILQKYDTFNCPNEKCNAILDLSVSPK